jgi:hypothetical protein
MPVEPLRQWRQTEIGPIRASVEHQEKRTLSVFLDLPLVHQQLGTLDIHGSVRFSIGPSNTWMQPFMAWRKFPNGSATANAHVWKKRRRIPSFARYSHDSRHQTVLGSEGTPLDNLKNLLGQRTCANSRCVSLKLPLQSARFQLLSGRCSRFCSYEVLKIQARSTTAGEPPSQTSGSPHQPRHLAVKRATRISDAHPTHRDPDSLCTSLSA